MVDRQRHALDSALMVVYRNLSRAIAHEIAVSENILGVHRLFNPRQKRHTGGRDLKKERKGGKKET
jgi:hypothetical protein